jgi:hypothetical protein
MDTASYVLTDLIDDEQDTAAVATTSFEESKGALREPVVRDLWLLRGLGPRVGIRVRVGSQEVKGMAGLVLGEADVAALGPGLAILSNLLELFLKRGEVAVTFQVELELGEQ